MHIVMTDHKIVRAKSRAGDLLAEKPEKHETAANSYRGEVVPYYPEKPAKTPEDRNVSWRWRRSRNEAICKPDCGSYRR